MKNFKNLFLAVLILFTTGLFSQVTVSGTVVDDLGPLLGASVLEKGTENGVSTELDGTFLFKTKSNSGILEFSYVGFKTKLVAFSKRGNLGKIQLESDANTLDDVVIIGRGVVDLAGGRKTPVAVSTIKAAEIQNKIGTQDVTAALVNTPSVYVAGQSGGFGNSRIAVRGFSQVNTAYLINGQPINGMTNGKMFWSNWSGINDIAAAVQIQRGLGASKLAISSVGGTTNFVVKPTGKKEGGFISGAIANNNYYKTAVMYNSGVNQHGLAASVMFSHWQGDGYMDGNNGAGQTYFISLGYKLNEKHNFNFLVTAAPQSNDRASEQTIATFLDKGKRYNNNWGTYKGDYMHGKQNFYHKPVANLNWDYKINETSNISTVLYGSWGRGGGTSFTGNRRDVLRTDNGQIDYDAIYKKNESILNGRYGKGVAAQASMNLHNWYGVVSNFEKKINDNLTFNFGIDGRSFSGEHFRTAVNFLGLDTWKDTPQLRNHLVTGHPKMSVRGYKNQVVDKTIKANPYAVTFSHVDDKQRLGFNSSETISYVGTFTQLEYANEDFSAFFQGALSKQYHTRLDTYNYVDSKLLDGTHPSQGKDLPSEITTDGTVADKVSNLGYNVKGGFGYNINQSNKVFVNSGYYSKQPFHNDVYASHSNFVNDLTTNEKVFGLEFGYSYSSSNLTGNINFYRTSWKDRVTASSSLNRDTQLTEVTTNYGVEQLHQGGEIDFTYKPIDNLKVKGFLSYGDWVYKGKGLSRVVDENQDLLSEKFTDYDGGRVGDAAQTTIGLGLDYRVYKNISIDTDYRYNDRLYANVGAVKENLELPSYSLVDTGISYKVSVTDSKSIRFRFNVNNVFNTEYLSEIKRARGPRNGFYKADDQIDYKDASKGTYKSNGKLYKGIATDNSAFFGKGRTWNFSVRYNF